MTMVQSVIRIGDTGVANKLVLEFQGRVIELQPTSEPLKVGREPPPNLAAGIEFIAVGVGWVSRDHGLIEYKRGHYTFSDISTNGTYVRLDDGEEVLVHRDEHQLRKTGVISLGKAAGQNLPEMLIRYRCG
jgi:hypothetical protein